MKPNFHCDVLPLALGADDGMGGPVLRGRMLALLHGIFVRSGGRYAIALPPVDAMRKKPLFGGALRIFASVRDELDELVAQASVMPWFRDYARFTYPSSVPADFDGTWTCFARYRVPSIRQDRHEGDAHGHLRARRMEEAKKQGLAYFILDSGSNRQRFSLFVQSLPGQAQKEDCQPNGYGLSVASRPFALPEMPWA